jgi:hypothetical protein
MSKFGSTQELHARIGKSLEKLKSSKLEIQEFEGLLNEARELYERLLILRYKAFENYVSGNPLPESLSDEDANRVVVEEVENKSESQKEELETISSTRDSEQLIVDLEEPDIEFALFGEIAEQSIEPIFSHNESLDDSDEPKMQAEDDNSLVQSDHLAPNIPNAFETNTNPSVLDNQKDEQKANSGGSLLDQFATGSQTNRLSDQLKKSRIQAIASALTLNDRIRFSKNLFGGNSETFNAAVQLFDAQKSMMEAMELLKDYSERFHWNQDEQVTMDFYELVERRHA